MTLQKVNLISIYMGLIWIHHCSEERSKLVTSSDANIGHFLLVSQEVLCSQARIPGLFASEAQQPASWEGEELPQG